MLVTCRRTEARGFTVIEVVVALSVIAILAGLVTTCTSWARCRAAEARAASRASHLDQALELFHIKHRRYPSAYPAELSTRLAPYLEEDLSDCVDNDEAFVAPASPSAGAEPLNKSYAPSSPVAGGGRYVLSVQPGHRGARTAALFASHIIGLVETLPMQYGSASLAPADVVEGGTVTFTTGTRIELGASTMLRTTHSFRAEEGTVYHVVKMPRHRAGFLRANVVGSDVVQVVTGAGTVCIRNGVADIDVIPVVLATPAQPGDLGDDPIATTYSITEDEDPPPDSNLGDFALFSATSLACGGNSSIDHLIGSNSNITLGASCDASGITGGGSLTTGANLTVDGNVVANGAVNLGGNTEISGNVDTSEGATLQGVAISGDLTAAGNVAATNATIKGDFTSGGSVEGGANFAAHGDVNVNGDLSLSANAMIYGDADYTGSLDAKPKQIMGDAEQVGSVDVSPEQYTPFELPPATTFTAGSQDVSVSSNGTLNLPPGHYGNLTLSGGAEITFSAGEYTFQSITAQGNANIIYDVDDDEGGIEIFSSGDATFGGTVATQVQGSGTAADIYFEGHGDFAITGNTTWHGTIYVPEGQATVGGNSTLNGACYASGAIDLGHHATVHYVGSERGIGDGGQDDGEGDGGGDTEGEIYSGGTDGSPGSDGSSVIETHVRVSNHSAEVMVDARISGHGTGVPYITRREGESTGRKTGLSFGKGTYPKTGYWVDAVEF